MKSGCTISQSSQSIVGVQNAINSHRRDYFATAPDTEIKFKQETGFLIS